MESTRLYIRIFYIYTIEGSFAKSFKTVCKQSPFTCIYINGKIFNLLNDISGGKHYERQRNRKTVPKVWAVFQQPAHQTLYLRRMICKGISDTVETMGIGKYYWYCDCPIENFIVQHWQKQPADAKHSSAGGFYLSAPWKKFQNRTRPSAIISLKAPLYMPAQAACPHWKAA